MKKIILTQNKVCLVDNKDFDWLNQFKWYTKNPRTGKTQYAHSNQRGAAGKQATLVMHRLILDVPKGAEVDHINGNGLDNRRRNLRICTRSENQWNRRLAPNNTSGFKGVYRFQGKWRAQIQSFGKKIHIGLYETRIEAARAYDEVAIKCHGDFAATNKRLGLLNDKR